MEEIQPPETHFNDNGSGGGGGAGGGRIAVTSSETVGSKRQRRPSVRLGEIGGEQVYDGHPRRFRNVSKSPYSLHASVDQKDAGSSMKGSKTRPLTNLTTSGEFAETLDEDKEGNLDTIAIGSWRVKDSKKRASNATTKRVRSNWASKVDQNTVQGQGDNTKYSGGEEDFEDAYKEFEVENSESLLREQSPVENLGDGNERNERDVYYNRRGGIRARDSFNHNHDHNQYHDHHDGVELSGPSDTDAREFRNNGRCEDGVRIWLNSIGLGRYASVFEIHEVDDEVLPMLTLEDLKDMGINAVGSRRKMFCAIQKLGKGFS